MAWAVKKRLRIFPFCAKVDVINPQMNKTKLKIKNKVHVFYTAVLKLSG